MQPTAPSTYQVCGVPITAVPPFQAAALVVEASVVGRPFQVHLCNAYTLSLVDRDPKLRAALDCADMNLPDGVPVAWLGRRFGTSGPVRGPGLVGHVAEAGVVRGLKHYLYGGASGVAAEKASRLVQHAPGAQIVGLETPTYSELDDTELRALAERINESGANIVWVGLGTPRQDYLVPRLAPLVRGAVVPVGAAFDFWSGRVPEAPKILHGSGLEWMHRLASEPRRLWRRYLFGNPRFVLAAYRHARTERVTRAES